MPEHPYAPLTRTEAEILSSCPQDTQNLLYGHYRLSTGADEDEIGRGMNHLIELGYCEMNGIHLVATDQGNDMREAW